MYGPLRLARGGPGREGRGLGWLITWVLLALLGALAVFTHGGATAGRRMKRW